MSDHIQQAVRSQYGAVATKGLSSEQSSVRAVAEAFGYSSQELSSIPAEANMGLSCGNPTAFASLRTGETVLDLGSGGGLDVFLAATKVGPTGKAIGVDMTPEMVELARRNAATAAQGQPVSNVEFHLSTIDHLPLDDATVDCVISNCVINLVPDKASVFREIVRVLKPGGRLAISDIALKKTLPAEVSNNLLAYVGCIAGAIPIEQYRAGLVEAGFAEVDMIDSGADLNAYFQEPSATEANACCSAPPESSLPVVETSCCASELSADDEAALRKQLLELMQHYNVNDYAASVHVFAVKPA